VQPDVRIHTPGDNRHVMELYTKPANSVLNVRLLTACEQKIVRADVLMFIDAIKDEFE